MRGQMHLRVVGTLLVFAGAAACACAPAAAAGSYSPYDESASAALARYVRTLSSSPKDFGSLVGAGKAALEIGDAQAAAGFFARADEVNPRSPLPQAGMGAVSVANGEPHAAMPYFTRALQLGSALSQIGSDRGLAYDLLGQQKQAQFDYRAALNGPDSDEARRRLALSLAISGDKAGALQALSPLFAKRDPAAGRVRAFVLALTGDSNGAMVAMDSAMPGSWSRIAPFLQRLPALRPDQKAAAVNLGIFPDSSGSSLASASAPIVASYSARPSITSSVTTERLAGIDELLRGSSPPSAPTPMVQSPPAPVQVAYSLPAHRQQVAPAQRSKIWLQLASGSNAEALPTQFRRIKSRGGDLFDGIKGYVARGPGKSRLVIGPFRGTSDAQIFAEDLESVGVSSFRWTNSESDQIVPLGTE
jgi:tetratricopeptide (TPR) repeat protein